MPIINIADFQYVLETVQRTTPSLKFLTSDGAQYYLPVKQGQCPNTMKIQVADGTVYRLDVKTLVHEESTLNACKIITLKPGCYVAEIKGGKGGNGGGPNALEGLEGEVKTLEFTLETEANVVMFRGADGENGTYNNPGFSAASGGGGGASGVDTMIRLENNNTLLIAHGGTGGRGGFCQNRYAEVADKSSGGGGGGYYYTEYSDGYNAFVRDTYTEVFYICGAGGGGAVSGKSGAEAGSGLYVGEVGVDGTLDAGGNGGTFSRLGVTSKAGGTGGETVSFYCAGQNLYSYGGGGGGAINIKAVFPQSAEGGAGGSGSTGKSDTSYIRIYKIG